ncbi:MAG: DNA topoisomerase I, partial [Bacteroidaceae bacterium]|nr:DNA topoisomerase I [Bacteroidaceae bacterium]
DFEPLVDKALADKPEHKVGERLLGTDPVSGRPVSVKIGRYGPIVQIGTVSDAEKPRFAQLKKGQTIDNITLDEALELCTLPRTLGEVDGSPVIIGSGRFGPYVRHGKQFISLPDSYDPLTTTLDEALRLFAERAEQQASRILRTFDEDPEAQIINGPYGPYIAAHGTNVRLPRGTKPESLTYEAVQALVQKAKETPAKPRRTRAKKS